MPEVTGSSPVSSTKEIVDIQKGAAHRRPFTVRQLSESYFCPSPPLRCPAPARATIGNQFSMSVGYLETERTRANVDDSHQIAAGVSFDLRSQYVPGAAR